MADAESPQHPASLTVEQALQQAITHHQAGHLQDAERLYRIILQARPDQPEANHNLGVLAGQVGQYAAGLPYLRTALAINPSQGQYSLSYASALLATGQAKEALDILRTAMQHGFNTPAAQTLYQRAEAAAPNSTARAAAPTPVEMDQLVALFNAGCHAELESRARLLLDQYPESGFVWKVLGVSLDEQGKVALPALEKATKLSPDDAEAHSNLGDALKNLGRLDDAVASCRRALEINPDLAEAHSNLGNALQDLGQFEDAVASYRRALEINPNFAKARSNLLINFNLLPDQSPASMLAESRRYNEMVVRQARPHKAWRNVPDPARYLRVGLVSGDLRQHPVGHFLEGALAALSAHAAGRLEFHAYSNHSCADEVTERIRACCHGWHSAVRLSDEALAQQIRDDGIDILLDLSGHTAYNRLPVFAWKPAPVQVTWLGYFATTGVAAMDYLIADPWTLPETEEIHFSEKIWRLPETRLCFTPPDVDVAVAPLPALANGYITFGCFNNLTKVNDAVVALWAEVLQAVPDSRLFLKAQQLNVATARQGMVERFAACGIGADRMILEGSESRAKYLAAYQRVDIALDPFPYTGGTTSVEGLWMGVPVLTLAGESLLSRQGVGILRNAGLPDWIATGADDYVARAESYASDLQRLSALRNRLRQQVLASPIFDAPRFARNFEAALYGMWQAWCTQQIQSGNP